MDETGKFAYAIQELSTAARSYIEEETMYVELTKRKDVQWNLIVRNLMSPRPQFALVAVTGDGEQTIGCMQPWPWHEHTARSH